jgi:hypothetical protein
MRFEGHTAEDLNVLCFKTLVHIYQSAWHNISKDMNPLYSEFFPSYRPVGAGFSFPGSQSAWA